MGTFQEEHLIVQLMDLKEENIKKIDNFIIELEEDMQNLFSKHDKLTNGYIIYFMCWDGSKEWWDTSDRAEKIRNRFVKFIRKLDEYAQILHVIPAGEIWDKDEIRRL